MKRITIEACACIVERTTRSPNAPWIVREPITGLAISNPCRRQYEAIGDAGAKIRAAGGAAGFKSAIEAKLP